MKRYRQLMDRLCMDEEAKARMLQKLKEVEQGSRRVFFPYQRYLALAACFALLLLGTLYAVRPFDGGTKGGQNQQEQIHRAAEQLPQKVVFSQQTVRMEGRQALEKKVGFSLALPKNPPFDETKAEFYLEFDALARVDYRLDTGSVTFRQGMGQEENYDDFGRNVQEEGASVKGQSAKLYIDEGKCFAVSFFKDGFAFSLSAEKGMEKSAMFLLLEAALP